MEQTNQYVKQFPELMKGKTVMYLHGFGSSGQSGTVTRLRTILPNANVIAVKGDNVDAPLTKALVAAATSKQVKEYYRTLSLTVPAHMEMDKFSDSIIKPKM